MAIHSTRLIGAGMLFLFLSACATFEIPDEYVPDEKVVYLKQKIEFGPIRYEPVPADPYVFEPDIASVDAKNPGFLKNTRWDLLLKADFRADSRLFREAEAHLLGIGDDPVLVELRDRLDAEAIAPTPPLPPNKGEISKTYSNGAAYVYPDSPGASITILDTGYYRIDFADKSKFTYWEDGAYERTDSKGVILFQYLPQKSYIVSTVNGMQFTSEPGIRGIRQGQMWLRFHEAPNPQYRFTPTTAAGAPDYTIFVDENKEVRSIVVEVKELRYDYFPDNRILTVASGDQMITIDADFTKNHHFFDQAAREKSDLISIYLPEGIRFTNIDGKGAAFGEVNPAWPERYKQKTIGPFSILYTEKDEALVTKLDSARLTKLDAEVRDLSGLDETQNRTVIVPPDLDSYRKLHSSEPGEIMHWYPSGFESKDVIVMWPFSVPRYDLPEGEVYFFETELYEILAHEYVHLLVGRHTGLINPVPVWLNEGLAVYVESSLSPETMRYWDITFHVARGLNRLLDWDIVTTTGTGELEVEKARVHYAQSYAMVKALVERFGKVKVVEYIQSFRVKSDHINSGNLQETYKSLFKSVFGLEWSEAIDLLKEPPASAES